MIDPLRLRHTVGGASFLARGPLLLLVPTSLLTSLLSRDITDLRGLVGWSVANLLAFLACWGWVAIGDRALFPFRARHPVAVTLVVTFGASLGALKGVATDLAGALLGLDVLVGSSVLWRSAGTAVLGAAAVPAVAALAVAVERYRTEHALLVAETLGRMRDAEAGSALSAAERVGLTAFVDQARRTLGGVEPSEAAATIVRLVDERLRPLTHELWATGDAPPSELDGRALLRIAVLRNPLPLAVVVVPYTLSVVPPSVQAVGPVLGVLRSAVAGLGLLLVLMLARALRPERRGSAVAVVHLALTLLVATSLQIAQWDRFLGGMPDPSGAALWVTVGTWLTGLVLVGGAVAGALRDRARVREGLLRTVGPDVLRAVALEDHDRIEARRVATRLHGDLQGRMIAAARRIEGGGHAPEVVGQELDALDALLRDVLGTGDAEPFEPLEVRLDDLVLRWRGFIDVRFEPDVSDVLTMLAGRREVHNRFVQVVSEAIVNATRHGLAATATVRIEASGERIVVTVADDGIGPRSGTPGLGSAYFASTSGGDWSVTAGADGGTVLRVRLAG